MLTAVIGMFARCKQIQALCVLVKRAWTDLQKLKFETAQWFFLLQTGSVIIIALRWGDIVVWHSLNGIQGSSACWGILICILNTDINSTFIAPLSFSFFPFSWGCAYCAFSLLGPNKWGSQQCSYKRTYQRHTRTVHTHVNSLDKSSWTQQHSFINWKLPSELWPLTVLCCVGRHIPVTECEAINVDRFGLSECVCIRACLCAPAPAYTRALDGVYLLLECFMRTLSTLTHSSCSEFWRRRGLGWIG